MPHEIRPCPRCDAAGRVYDNPDPTKPPTVIACPACGGSGESPAFVYVLLADLRKHGRADARA